MGLVIIGVLANARGVEKGEGGGALGIPSSPDDHRRRISLNRIDLKLHLE